MKSILFLMLIPFAMFADKPGDERGVNIKDAHSYSNPAEIVVQHLDLNLKADFSTKKLVGFVDLQVKNLTHADTLRLDTYNLKIESVKVNDAPVKFILKPADEILGSELAIPVTASTKVVTINYETSPDARALQWLSPEQTAGKIYPFLFTQSEAILARSWIPLQDTPGIKFTWTATIHCPKELMALMSCPQTPKQIGNGNYSFKMPLPVPSYLMALSIGMTLLTKPMTTVVAFTQNLLCWARLFMSFQTPAMIASAEQLYGKYPWIQYDVLVLPPSFPFGGMENPCVTFATPTIITGDRSLVSLIAHELAHSWSGNLVTNATWNDFWLNEGFTVYFESRIMEKIYGKDYADMLNLLSQNELKHTVAVMGDNNPDTKLFLDLKGRDPDDGMGDIAYEKGRFFLMALEEAAGRDVWDAFLKKYFEEHRFQTMTTEKFVKYLDANLLQENPLIKQKVNVDEWVYGTGLPKSLPVIKSRYFDTVEKAAAAFIKTSAIPDTTRWTTHHYLHFLRTVAPEMTYEKAVALDNHFHFTQIQNSEIAFDWFMIAIACHYKPAYQALENFLNTVGRRKFIAPLYRKAAADTTLKPWIEKVYQTARPGYHAVAVKTIDEIFEGK
ncbi:MAG: M1 family metallopeptidase [Bacteroidetes bacterium]|nr:M1 family metallopeptidase [Bacteroidota bacterium]